MPPANPIPALVAKAITGTKPFTKARSKALSSVRYRLITPTGYIGNDQLFGACIVAPESYEVSIFDGRDNEVAICAFFSALFKCEVIPSPL